MPESETFDAFYARTVWSVTSQMHELAGDDGLADHAIREAYARAYQQWYLVSGYPDTEGWVLSAARDAYHRRRSEPGPLGHRGTDEPPGSGTWPGIYRPSRRPAREGFTAGLPPADPEATLTGAASPDAGAGAVRPGGTTGAAVPGYATAGMARADQAGPGSGRAGTGSRRRLLIAGVVVAALAVAGLAYVSLGGHQTPPAAAGRRSSGHAAARPAAHMLGAGHTGRRSAVPWSLVGAGWALAEYSAAPPDAGGGAAAGDGYTTYLVDPDGGKYAIASARGSATPQLIAWSGNARTALFSTPPGTAGSTASYRLLNIATGQFAALPLPPRVSAVGFTRPSGFNIIAVRTGSARYRLQRYSLTGVLQGSLAELPARAGAGWPSDGCGYGCALSSPDGLTAVWGIYGAEMQLVSNAGGVVRRLHVPDSGKPPSCVPLSWWNDDTILANCAATNLPGDAARLWLVAASGSGAQPVTQAAAAGTGAIEGAWQAGRTAYITTVSSRQCDGAPSGSVGLGIALADEAAPGATIAIPHTTGNVSTVVTTAGHRLLVLAQTSCPGTSSLLWFTPGTQAVTAVLTAPGTQAGVIAAVPYGNGPTALAAGQ